MVKDHFPSVNEMGMVVLTTIAWRMDSMGGSLYTIARH